MAELSNHKAPDDRGFLAPLPRSIYLTLANYPEKQKSPGWFHAPAGAKRMTLPKKPQRTQRTQRAQRITREKILSILRQAQDKPAQSAAFFGRLNVL